MNRVTRWWSTRSRGGSDEGALVRRATVTIAALIAGAVTVVVAAVMLLAVYLTVREQHIDAERIVREAATNADDVNDPPAGVVLLLRRPGQALQVSADAPPELVTLDPASLPAGPSQRTLGDDHGYQFYAYDRGTGRVVAALDLRYRARESDRLLGALLPAGLLGIAAAAVIGLVLARRAVRPLGTALALQRRFVADASHELRTPLAILHTRAQLLRRRAGPDPELRENLDRLIDDSRALAEIVGDLLLSAELSHRPAASEPVDLAELARAVVQSFSALAEREGVALTAVAPTGAGLTVAGVPAALRRALSALIDNALGHTPAGGSITVMLTRRDSMIALAVADTGEGLDPAETADLTRRFARGRDSPGTGRRFGLGLALVGEVVHAHHGTLTLEGSPGQGATATMTLPALSG